MRKRVKTIDGCNVGGTGKGLSGGSGGEGEEDTLRFEMQPQPMQGMRHEEINDKERVNGMG